VAKDTLQRTQRSHLLTFMHDVIIIGTGPAGLQASMTLSRYRRRHLIISIPKLYRNRNALEMHGFLTGDGTTPLEFIEQARGKLNEYRVVTFVDGRVVSSAKVGQVFEVKLEDGTEYAGRKLIIATGSMDFLLPINGVLLVYITLLTSGFAELWGTDIVHCVCCGGYEHRDKPCATIGLRSDMELDSAMKALSVASSVHLFPHLEDPDLVPLEMKKKTLLVRGTRYHDHAVQIHY